MIPLIPVLSLALLAAASGPSDLQTIKDEAVGLYDRGSYREALTSLESLDHAGALDGPSLYRMYFCQRAAGREEEAAQTLERARQTLETELPSSDTLDVPFYLANAYSNLGKAAEARDLARGVTTKLESGAMKVPQSGIGLFQVGKLYQDQGRQDDAVAYYKRAVAALDLTGGRYVGNARWALRYVGTVAAAREDYAGVEAAYEKLGSIGAAEAGDWSALGVARARLGKLNAAAEAWTRAVKLDPANADDARYSAKLAETAAILAPLPATAPGGAAFRAMGKADLEAAMKDRAEITRSVQERAKQAMEAKLVGGPAFPLPAELRTSLDKELREARGQFVAAALEYAMRGLPIRETAFREGYAVRIFQDTDWELPPDP